MSDGLVRAGFALIISRAYRRTCLSEVQHKDEIAMERISYLNKPFDVTYPGHSGLRVTPNHDILSCEARVFSACGLKQSL